MKVMNKQPLTDFIQSTMPVPTPVVDKITAHFEEKAFNKNDYFLKAGSVSNEYYFLAEGVMRAFTFDTDGNEVTTYFYTRNRVVFEASSFFMHTISTENIQALTACEGYVITFDNLNMLFHSIPEFREFGRAMLVREFVAFKQRTLAMINKSAEERYESLITTEQEIFKYAHLKYIASYLGITDTSLSRIRREFAKKELKKAHFLP